MVPIIYGFIIIFLPSCHFSGLHLQPQRLRSRGSVDAGFGADEAGATPRSAISKWDFSQGNGWICNMVGFSGQKHEFCFLKKCFFLNMRFFWSCFSSFLIGKSCYFLGKTLDFRWLMIFEDLRWFRRLSELDKYRTTEHYGKTCVFFHLFKQFSASFDSKLWNFTV